MARNKMDNDDLELQNKIATRIKELRSQLGITQAKLAEMLEIDRQTTFKWEHEEGVTIYSIAKICKVLNISISDFFKGL